MFQMSYIKILNGPNSDEGQDSANTGPMTGEGDWSSESTHYKCEAYLRKYQN